MALLKWNRLISILITACVLAIAFTNCDHVSSPELTDSNALGTPSSAGYNGGGHSGKVTLVSTVIQLDTCTIPLFTLVIDGASTRSFSRPCGSVSPVELPFDAKSVTSYAFDRDFLIYEERIYASENLLQTAPSEKAQFHLYCANSEAVDPTVGSVGLSFALKVSKFSMRQGLITRTLGYLIRGRLPSPSLVRTAPGKYRDIDANGVRVFEAADYTVEIEKPLTPTRARGAVHFKNSGQQIPVDCVVKEIPLQAGEHGTD